MTKEERADAVFYAEIEGGEEKLGCSKGCNNEIQKVRERMNLESWLSMELERGEIKRVGLRRGK